MIVDASVAVLWYIPGDKATDAEILLEQDELIAPDLVVAEVLNAIWKNVRFGAVPRQHLELAAFDVGKRFGRLIPAAEVATSAAEIAYSLEHPIYDCLYLATALREGQTLITADKRLFKKASADERFSGRIRLLGE